MKQSGRLLARLAFGLLLAAPAGTTSTRAAVPAATRFDIYVQADGQIALREGDVVRVVPPQSLHYPVCPHRKAMTIGSDPNAKYRSFMVVANWLQDCGVREMRIAREAAGRRRMAGRLLADMRMKPAAPGSAPPICPRPPPGVDAPADDCPGSAYRPPTMVSLRQTGLFIGAGRGMKPTTLDDLVGDLRTALGTDDPKSQQIVIVAAQDVGFGKVADLLERLTRDGYTRIGLISEEVAP